MQRMFIKKYFMFVVESGSHLGGKRFAEEEEFETKIGK
jgi:hypothetical protein